MNSRHRILFTLLGITLLYSCITTVSGLVVQDIVIFKEMDVDFYPIEQLNFYQDDDAVRVMVNVTDPHVNDIITFEWRNPAGEVYLTQEWVAPPGVEGASFYDLYSEIEIQGDPAENMLGMWVVKISSDGGWWNHSFSINGGTSDESSTTPASSDYLVISDIQLPSSYNPGENVTVGLTLDYSFEAQTDIAPSVWNNNTWMFISTVEDSVVGSGSKTYNLEFMADDPETVYYILAYYIENEEIVYDEYHGLESFVLDLSTGGSSLTPSSGDNIKLPTDINVDEIKSQINDYIGYGLEFIEKIEVPDELKDVEETIKEKTGIPGFPFEALVAGATLLGLALKRRS